MPRRGVALGDLDGDGSLDAVIVNSGATRVWLNDGSGTAFSGAAVVGSAAGQEVSVNDLDGDGELESRRGGLDPQLLVPHWTILRW